MQANVIESLLSGATKPLLVCVVNIVLIGLALFIAISFYKIRLKRIIKKIENALSKNDLSLAKKHLRVLERIDKSSNSDLDASNFGNHTNKLTNIIQEKKRKYVHIIQELEGKTTQHINNGIALSINVPKKNSLILIFLNKLLDAICFLLLMVCIIGCPLLITKYMKNLNSTKIMSGGMILIIWIFVPLTITILFFLIYERFRHRS